MAGSAAAGGSAAGVSDPASSLRHRWAPPEVDASERVHRHPAGTGCAEWSLAPVRVTTQPVLSSQRGGRVHPLRVARSGAAATSGRA